MAERRCVLTEKTRLNEQDEYIPTVELERFCESAGADLWVPNPNKTRPFAITEQKGGVKKTGRRTLPLYPVWGMILAKPFLRVVGTPLATYGEYLKSNDRGLISRIHRFTWHRFASVIQAKSGIKITGFGSALVHKEDVLVPLYLEREEDEPCRIFLQFPLVQLSLTYPYDSLLDRIWATVATLRFLEDRSQLPVPHVYYFFLEGVDILGGNCPWMILERLPGMSLSSWIAHLSTSQIQHIGQQWGNSLAITQSFRFNSIGALRTNARGKFVTTQTVGSDPDGNHLIAEHYSFPSCVYNVVTSRPRDNPRTSIDYLLSLARTSTIRLIKRFSRKMEDGSYDTHEKNLWGLTAFIGARHLHSLIPQYSESNIFENYFTFDLANFEFGNIHIDSTGYICGIVDWSGVNIVPSHIAVRLPQTFQITTWLGEPLVAMTAHNQDKLRMLQHSVMNQFEQVMREKGVLALSTVPGGVGMAAVWAKGSRAKDFERLLYRFIGDGDSVEFKVFLTYVEDSWTALFREGQSYNQKIKVWRKLVQKRWDAIASLYSSQCAIPPIPRSPTHTNPNTPPLSDMESSTPKKKYLRFRKPHTQRPKCEISSFEMDDPPRLGKKIAAITDDLLRINRRRRHA